MYFTENRSSKARRCLCAVFALDGFRVEVKGFSLNVSHERLKEQDGMASCVLSGILHSQFHKMVTDRWRPECRATVSPPAPGRRSVSRASRIVAKWESIYFLNSYIKGPEGKNLKMKTDAEIISIL